MIKRILAVTIIFLVAFFKLALAQQLPDSTAYNTALTYYINGVGVQSEIFKGTEYIGERVHKGSAFFMDKSSWLMATIVYDGNTYKNVPVLYDCYKDVLIGKYYNDVVGYIFRPEITTDFEFENHHFVRISAANVKNSTKDAYYEKVYNGNSTVIIKRGKVKSESLSQQEGVRVTLDDVSKIYIKKNNIYNPVKSKGDVLKLLKDKSEALKKYLKSASIRFNEDPEKTIIKLATYYDQLSL